ncbi:hypothetical protein [Robertkochia solimangrovi]|uniref:hypothetical protein n=1 Tax=Robertkochia solimangrovi TaxID=2213046 RepID=UPI0011804003|nr:hypothetical protein [Robertkochia solimangrovi]TRZ44336.1 hypothetical protein DMZ48_07440 [Robertkochia solimangrovi]
MPQTNHVQLLIITGCENRAGELYKITENSGLNSVFCKNSFEAIQKLKSEQEFDLILIDKDAGPLKALQFSEYLTLELSVTTPIVVVGGSQEEYILSERTFKQLNDPISEVDLQKILIELPIAKIKGGRSSSFYSLNYLKDLSDNDQDFIAESISIFKTSVEQKLIGLQVTIAENDFKKSREITHNIKPSFEMLENDECRELCDTICYRASEEEIPALVQILLDKFTKIIEELKYEFPKLNDV